MPKAKKITAPNGQTYKSIQAMCDAYGVSISAFYTIKREMGISLDETLKRAQRIHAKSLQQRQNRPVLRDCEGRTFKTIREMAKFHGINESTLGNRVRREPMGGPHAWLRPVTQHPDNSHLSYRVSGPDGRTFSSIKALADHYDVNEYSLRKCVNSGRFDSYALAVEHLIKKPNTGPQLNAPIKDHLGGEFLSAEEMLRHHNVKHSTYYARKAAHPDWPTEKLLAKPRKTKN